MVWLCPKPCSRNIVEMFAGKKANYVKATINRKHDDHNRIYDSLFNYLVIYLVVEQLIVVELR